jgi:hypothetical protein
MCGCISDCDNRLREHNTCLVTTLFSRPERVAIRTDKIVSKTRKGPVTLIASFCPFCGEKYPQMEPLATPSPASIKSGGQS